jgi:hypothetical protein
VLCSDIVTAPPAAEIIAGCSLQLAQGSLDDADQGDEATEKVATTFRTDHQQN